MSFEFEQKNRYEYDTDTECVVLTEPDATNPQFNVKEYAECSECGGDIHISQAVGNCPNCGRNIIDWKQRPDT